MRQSTRLIGFILLLGATFSASADDDIVAQCKRKLTKYAKPSRSFERALFHQCGAIFRKNREAGVVIQMLGTLRPGDRESFLVAYARETGLCRYHPFLKNEPICVRGHQEHLLPAHRIQGARLVLRTALTDELRPRDARFVYSQFARRWSRLFPPSQRKPSAELAPKLVVSTDPQRTDAIVATVLGRDGGEHECSTDALSDPASSKKKIPLRVVLGTSGQVADVWLEEQVEPRTGFTKCIQSALANQFSFRAPGIGETLGVPLSVIDRRDETRTNTPQARSPTGRLRQ